VTFPGTSTRGRKIGDGISKTLYCSQPEGANFFSVETPLNSSFEKNKGFFLLLKSKKIEIHWTS
jgi:hypothetical protein